MKATEGDERTGAMASSGAPEARAAAPTQSSAPARAAAPTQASTPIQPAAPAPRRKVPLLPREHGAVFMSVHAWIMGLVASVTWVLHSARGEAFPGLSPTGILLSAAGLALFLLLAGAVSVWSHPSMRPAALGRLLGVGGGLALVATLALAHGPRGSLLTLGALALVPGAAYLLARRLTGPRSVPSQLAAIAGMAMVAPASALLASGYPRAVLLWAAGFVAFAGTVPYVRERVRRRKEELGLGQRVRRGSVALIWQAGALALAGLGWRSGVLHPLAAVAFVPGAVKTAAGILLPERRPPMSHLGYTETAVSTLFALLGGVGLGLPGLN